VPIKRVISIPVFIIAILLLFACASPAKKKTGEIVLKVTIDVPEDNTDTRLWIPYPVSDEDQSIEDVKINGSFSSSGIYREKDAGNLVLYAEWTEPTKERFITLSFITSARERVKADFPSVEASSIPVEVLPYVKTTAFIPTDGKVKEVASRLTKNKKTIQEKARTVYDWVVENTYRDPEVRGCGIGDVETTLAKKGGKCVDISSVFVAVSRAAGIPAREVFGLRLGEKGQTDITNGYHCWAEFYLPGYGWVPVDPADVRKMMLLENLDLEAADGYQEYFFGAVDESRIVLGKGGRGHYLEPRQKDGPINYFMYPYAEVNGKALEWLAAQKELKYQITFKEI